MEMNNIFILKDLIDLGGGQIMGRKKIQKIIYIIQEMKNPFQPPFEFKWNYYGVYSDELADELSVGEFFNIIQETPVVEYDYRSYAIETVEETMTEATFIKEDTQLRKLIQFLNGKESRLLEVLSSIMFFEKKGFTDEEVRNEVFRFKGHLREFFDDAYNVLNEIKVMV